MTMKEKVQAEMISAMKAKEEVKVSTLRMLKAAILKYETSGENMVATDEVIADLAKKEIKSRRDAAEGFRKGGNEEMAKKEEMEAEILKDYMPEQMSDEEIRTLVKAAIAETGVSSKAEMGKLMGVLMPKVKGKADGGAVNRIVGEEL